MTLVRHKLLRVSPELLVDLIRLKTPPGTVVSGLPDDARVVDARWSGERVYLTVESESFEEIPTFGMLPDLVVTFSRVAIDD